MPKLWLGLDVGTTAIKAAAYTSDGRVVAMAEAASTVLRSAEGGSEQDMAQVWQTAAEVLSSLTAKCSVDEFQSLGVCAQGDGLWCVNEDGVPTGPAMLWNDTRTADDVANLERSGATASVGRGCHTSLWSGTSGTLWRWLRDNSPDRANYTAHVLTCADWIGLNLTGRVGTDYSDASIPFLDLNSRGYSRASIEGLGCEDITEKLVPPQKANSLLGRITPAAATATRLPEGLPVSVGTLDLSAMLVGMGMNKAGQTMMILGTTAVVNTLTNSVETTDAPVGASALHPTSDVIIRILAPTTGAAAFDWFAALHPLSLGGETASEIAVKMNALVVDVPVGANGVTFLPYLNGERAPFVAPDIRAAFHGLSVSTTKAEMARAVMEGAAFSLRHCFEEEGGLPTAPVQLTGGGSKNTVWCQIIADVIGQPILVSTASDQGLWGVACIGASVTGLGDPVALAKRDENPNTYRPDAARHRAYGEVFARFRVLSQSQRDIQIKLKSLRETKT